MSENHKSSSKGATRLDTEHQLPAAGSRPAQDSAPQATVEQTAETQTQDMRNAEREALLDRVAQLKDELQNYRTRAAQDRQQAGELVLADALKSLLPIIDSLDRAISAPIQTVEDFRQGIKLIRRQLSDALSRLGVTPISASEQAFDPHVHEAVDVVETASTADNQVVEELLPGYKLKNRLLRPAAVRVARNPEDSKKAA
jgi:molecular chaperone GrpE